MDFIQELLQYRKRDFAIERGSNLKTGQVGLIIKEQDGWVAVWGKVVDGKLLSKDIMVVVMVEGRWGGEVLAKLT